MRAVAWVVCVAAALVVGARPGAARAQAPDVAWPTAQAAELTRQGRAHEARGDREPAPRRYLAASALEGSYGAAYLALGELHERGGDPREGERVYAVGIDHISGFADGYLARARLRMRQRRFEEAAGDLGAASSIRPDDLTVLEALVSARLAMSALPAALAVARRLEAAAHAAGNEALAAETRVRARALARLVREADPTAGAVGRGALRAALARHADKR
ncbi:MAG: tetratricopeptide repeat protein [Polyangiaceae bacterium]